MIAFLPRTHGLRRVVATAVCAAAAAALFVWSVRAAGVRDVLGGVGRAGRWFGVVLLLGGLRHLARAAAWRQALADPSRFPLRTAFAATLAGNAAGTLTPFGLFASEPSKIVFARSDVPAGESVRALAVENLFYAATVIVIVVAGLLTLLALAAVPSTVHRTIVTTIALAAVVGLSLAALAVCLRQWLFAGVATLSPRRGATILAIETAYHAAAVIEVWIVLAASTGAFPTFLTALVLESVSRAVTVVFQFVPMWLGVDEAASGTAAELLQIGSAAGVSLALVRKARILAWTAVGLTIGLARMRRRTADDRMQ